MGRGTVVDLRTDVQGGGRVEVGEGSEERYHDAWAIDALPSPTDRKETDKSNGSSLRIRFLTGSVIGPLKRRDAPLEKKLAIFSTNLGTEMDGNFSMHCSLVTYQSFCLYIYKPEHR
jgi:hypothetical protein